MSEPVYTQGICEDGAAILEDGSPLTVEQILGRLNTNADMVKALESADRYFTRFHEAVGRGPASVTTANKIRSALAKAAGG